MVLTELTRAQATIIEAVLALLRRARDPQAAVVAAVRHGAWAGTRIGGSRRLYYLL
jgi:hypothetical protein